MRVLNRIKNVAYLTSKIKQTRSYVFRYFGEKQYPFTPFCLLNVSQLLPEALFLLPKLFDDLRSIYLR